MRSDEHRIARRCGPLLKPVLRCSSRTLLFRRWLRDYFHLVLFGYDNGTNPDRDPIADQDGAFFVSFACMTMAW